jgi:hypothetical protein
MLGQFVAKKSLCSSGRPQAVVVRLPKRGKPCTVTGATSIAGAELGPVRAEPVEEKREP